MDSCSNSAEVTPKTEIDEGDASKKVLWTTENTAKLIEVFEKDCRELWDPKNVSYKDRTARQARLEYLAGVFGMKKSTHLLFYPSAS